MLNDFFAKSPRGPLKSVTLKLAIPNSLLVRISIDGVRFSGPLSFFGFGSSVNGFEKSENAAEGDDGKLRAELGLPLPALPKILGPTGSSEDNIFFHKVDLFKRKLFFTYKIRF